MSTLNYDAIEKQFSVLLQILANSFSDDEMKEISDFIEVGEYGLALQTFVDIVKEERKRIPLGAYVAVEELATLMGVADKVDMESVRCAVE